MKTLKVETVWHYDTKDVACNRDYFCIDLIVTDMESNKIIYQTCYGDSYHDKGAEKFQAVYEFIKAMYSNLGYYIDYISRKIADGKGFY